jgi:hypothetical protein
MKTTTHCLNFAAWKKLQSKGGTYINKHLDLMERGTHGHFSQRLFYAMERADCSNQRRLFDAFPELFVPAPHWYSV